MNRLSMLGIVFIFLTIGWTVSGQLLVKKGMLEVGSSPAEIRRLPGFIGRALVNWKVILGVCCAVAATLSWIVALSRAPLSFAYPFFGLAIVLVLALSGLLLDERIPLTRWIGVGIVCLGIFVASR